MVDEAFYSHAKLYDLMFPGGGPAVDFYRAEAGRTGGQVLELGCGTGHKLIPIASDGYSCVGLDLSSDMLAEARRKADECGVVVEWLQGDMTAFDLGRTFDFVFITANSLLHLHEIDDLVSCFRSVRRHLAPGARFIFDVFNPSVRVLAERSRSRPGEGRCRGDLRCACAGDARDVAPLDRLRARRCRRPTRDQEHLPAGAPLLISLGGLRLVRRFGDWSGGPFSGEAPLQLCVCESA